MKFLNANRNDLNYLKQRKQQILDNIKLFAANNDLKAKTSFKTMFEYNEQLNHINNLISKF